MASCGVVLGATHLQQQLLQRSVIIASYLFGVGSLTSSAALGSSSSAGKTGGHPYIFNSLSSLSAHACQVGGWELQGCLWLEMTVAPVHHGALRSV